MNGGAIGHTLPHGAHVEFVVLDGRTLSGGDYVARETNRGLEVSAVASPRKRHTLVVTAA